MEIAIRASHRSRPPFRRRAFGILGAIFLALDFPIAPILLGYVLGPMAEEDFRRSLLLSHGELSVFVHKPISAAFLGVCLLLILGQLALALRRTWTSRKEREESRLRNSSRGTGPAQTHSSSGG
jgi:TctA family transporter